MRFFADLKILDNMRYGEVGSKGGGEVYAESSMRVVGLSRIESDNFPEWRLTLGWQNKKSRLTALQPQASSTSLYQNKTITFITIFMYKILSQLTAVEEINNLI